MIISSPYQIQQNELTYKLINYLLQISSATNNTTVQKTTYLINYRSKINIYSRIQRHKVLHKISYLIKQHCYHIKIYVPSEIIA